MSDSYMWLENEADTRAIVRGSDPWGDWLAAIGITSGFPILEQLRRPHPELDDFDNPRPTADSKRFFLNRPHLLQLGEIYQSLHTARAVITAPGHGASTLSRYLFAKADIDTIIRKSIPVLVSLEDIMEIEYSSLVEMERSALVGVHRHIALGRFGLLEHLRDPESRRRREEWADERKEEADRRARMAFSRVTVKRIATTIDTAVHAAVIRSIITRPWERAMGRARYRDLVGASSPQPDDLAAKRRELRRFVPEHGISEASLDHLGRIAPELVPPDYRSLIARLNNACGVRISLLLDLSATPAGRFYIDDVEGEYFTEPYLEVLEQVAAAIKNIEQRGQQGPTPTLPSLLDKTYIMASDAWQALRRNFAADLDDIIDFPPFRPIDLFAMLAHHYPPHQDESGRRAEVLAAVVDSGFVQITPNRAVSTEMASVRAMLERSVNDSGDATYQQHPDPGMRAVVPRLIEAIVRLNDVIRARSASMPERSTRSGGIDYVPFPEDALADLELETLQLQYPVKTTPGAVGKPPPGHPNAEPVEPPASEERDE